MLGHKQKLLGHVPRCAGAWLRHCDYYVFQEGIYLLMIVWMKHGNL